MWLFNPKQQTPLTLKNTNPIFTYLPREKSFSHLRLLFKEEINRLLHRPGPGVSPESPGAWATPLHGATKEGKKKFNSIQKKKKKTLKATHLEPTNHPNIKLKKEN